MNARRRDVRSFVLAIAIALSGTGCSGAGGPDACALVAGKMFASVNQMECGPGANGVATFCNWRVSFTDDAHYAWSHSDVAETGMYSCDGPTITATRAASTTPLLGRLDFQTGQLTWDGATYVVE